VHDLSSRRGAANDMAARVASERAAAVDTVLPLLCECSDPTCNELLIVPLEEFTALRRHGRPLTAAEHQVDEELAPLS
jgi:hypothetical protein